MRLIDFENGIHNWEDLNKKFHGTYILGETQFSPNPTIILIKEILPEEVICHDAHHDEIYSCPLKIFLLDKVRPDPGIVNITNNLASTRPICILKRSRRQWRVGACDENLFIHDVRRNKISLKLNLSWENLEEIFKPKYPSFEEAIDLLTNNKLKHVAINPRISLMRGTNRFILFKNFVPLFAYAKGMTFKIIPNQEFVEEDYDKYSNLFKQYL